MGKVSRNVSTVITASTRFPALRSAPRKRTNAEKLHIKHVGEIVHASNQAHGALFHVFMTVACGRFEIELAHGLWHSVQSDNGQRAMLEAAVKARFPKPTNSYRTGILWAIAALNNLSTHRNDAAHVEIISGFPEIIPAMSSKRSSSERLEKSPLAKHWRVMRGDLFAITHYLEAVYIGLWNDFPRPLSRRPKLQFARTTSESTQQKRRLTKKLAQERQRLSSRQ
ncbi:hypothetical protein [Sphingorhabdus sp.]|jgi:hypothetical protein|uniref:hypothetical protein n=1 Tax=Sphingorhabdus sp. TaxID=1902408 RepID=UPI0037C5AF84